MNMYNKQFEVKEDEKMYVVRVKYWKTYEYEKRIIGQRQQKLKSKGDDILYLPYRVFEYLQGQAWSFGGVFTYYDVKGRKQEIKMEEVESIELGREISKEELENKIKQ